MRTNQAVPPRGLTCSKIRIVSVAATAGCAERLLTTKSRNCAESVAPTTMIFVPCLGGISHNEAESTTLEECGAGSQVLLNAVLAYDRTLA